MLLTIEQVIMSSFSTWIIPTVSYSQPFAVHVLRAIVNEFSSNYIDTGLQIYKCYTIKECNLISKAVENL